jgi:hypothetical protein
MAKYLLLWKMDPAAAPADPKERAAAWGMLLNMVKGEVEQGLTESWGAFAGELRGFTLVEANQLELMLLTTKYLPYVSFEVHRVASVSEVQELIDVMAQ